MTKLMQAVLLVVVAVGAISFAPVADAKERQPKYDITCPTGTEIVARKKWCDNLGTRWSFGYLVDAVWCERKQEERGGYNEPPPPPAVKHGPYLCIVTDEDTHAQLVVLRANYKDGEPHGKWEERWNPETIDRTGQYCEGQKCGKWILYHSNGKKQEEIIFKEGRADGLAAEWHDNGQQRWTGQNCDGERCGKWKFWNRNGKPSMAGAYGNDGTPCGHWMKWHRNGLKEEEGEYGDDGVMVGKWQWWDKDGQLMYVISFKDGDVAELGFCPDRTDTMKRHDFVFGAAAGGIQPDPEKSPMADGKPDGFWRFVYPNGKIHASGHFEDGHRDNWWAWRDPQDHLMFSILFVGQDVQEVRVYPEHDQNHWISRSFDGVHEKRYQPVTKDAPPATPPGTSLPAAGSGHGTKPK